MRKFIKPLLLLTVLGGGYYGYNHFIANSTAAPAAGKPQGSVPVEAAKVREGELIVTLDTVGTLNASESLILRPEIAGRIDAIHFAEGSTVAKGDLLISIDDRIYAAELKQAEAALKLAQVNFNRAKLLKEKGAGTVSNYDVSAATLSAAQAQVDLSKAKLDKTKLIAPFDGKVGLRSVSPGDYVNVGQDMVGFQSLSPMKADFALPEKAARFVAKDQTITITVDAFPDRSFTGKVYALDPKIDEQNRSILLRAEVPNEDGVLQAGFFARISLIIDRKQSALFVPESALLPSGNKNAVYVVNAENKITTKDVTVGERKNGEVEIVQGLSAGDIVVTAGHLKVREGADVSYTLVGEAK
jgi:membrane fusion protein (multidrug efflux system)